MSMCVICGRTRAPSALAQACSTFLIQSLDESIAIIFNLLPHQRRCEHGAAAGAEFKIGVRALEEGAKHRLLRLGHEWRYFYVFAPQATHGAAITL